MEEAARAGQLHLPGSVAAVRKFPSELLSALWLTLKQPSVTYLQGGHSSYLCTEQAAAGIFEDTYTADIRADANGSLATQDTDSTHAKQFWYDMENYCAAHYRNTVGATNSSFCHNWEST